MKTIGVFDSGVGGLGVANAIRLAMPNLEVLLREDKENLPYGNKTPNQLFELVKPILLSMVSDGCELIVVACNTVTTSIIDKLREVISVPLIGMEPMIKPASLITKSGVIAVFATPTTLSTKRYAYLKSEYAKGLRVVEPDCSRWSYMIENDDVNEADIKKNVDLVKQNDADVIVLGCTHYHWIEQLIKDLAGENITVLQPELPVIEQLKTYL